MVDGYDIDCLYVELPSYLNGNIYTWDDDSANRFADVILNFKLRDYALINHKFVTMKKTNFFSGNRGFPMLCLTFANLHDLNSCFSILDKPFHTQEWGWVYCRVWDKMSVY